MEIIASIGKIMKNKRGVELRNLTYNVSNSNVERSVMTLKTAKNKNYSHCHNESLLMINTKLNSFQTSP